jgi:hypothetical protein
VHDEGSTWMSSPEPQLSVVLNDLTPLVVSSASIGGSRVMISADEQVEHALTTSTFSRRWGAARSPPW